MYFYRARYYSPGVSRFLSEEPLNDSARIRNLLQSKDVTSSYAYAQNDPLKWKDRLGMAPGQVHMRPWVSGNWLPWLNGKQDGRCTVPLVGQTMDRNPCIKGCCQMHDECYELFGCNMTTWGTDGACTICNVSAVKCVIASLWDPARQPKCPCK